MHHENVNVIVSCC